MNSPKGVWPKAIRLSFLSALGFVATNVITVSATSVNVTTHLDSTGATPFSIWGAAAILGVVLFLITLRTRTLSSELEADAIVSVIAWIPILFTAYTSFAVDRIVSSFAVVSGSDYQILEDHIIYHFDVLGILFGVLFLIAIINTIRIISLHKVFRSNESMESTGVEQE